MKSFKPAEIEEVIKYIRHLDVEEQFDEIKIDQNARNLIIKSDQLKEQKCISLRWDDTSDILIADEVEKYLYPIKCELTFDSVNSAIKRSLMQLNKINGISEPDFQLF